MRLITTIFLFLFTIGISAEEITSNEGTGQVATGEAKLQKAASIEQTEGKLDQIIKEMNDRLKKHTKLFRMKVVKQPHKTFIYKGKAEGDKCVISEKPEDQLSSSNDCLKLEVFDFLGVEDGKVHLNVGARHKYIVLFFEGAPSEEDPKKAQPMAIKKIVSKIYVDNFKQDDIKISEVVDNEPADAKHSKITIFYQHDGLPPGSSKQNPSDRGIGLYNLTDVENTKTNPIRNTFKKNFYIKHLDFFDKLFTYIYDSNERNGNERYRESNKVLKNSLKY
ncbi:MAG: hypothetical protein AAF518_21545 [Spirochaetota bacterium]